MSLPLKHVSLKNIIIIESHNDFDCNGGALYQYLIDNNYNSSYKIVWLIKHPEDIPNSLPENVVCVPAYRPSIKKNYYKWVAKYMSFDQDCERKLRKDQISLYCTHGAIALKNCAGLANVPKDVNYCLSPSEFYTPILANQLGLKQDGRFVICGYPEQDILFSESKGDFYKISNKKYNKIILWMPTFRVSETGRKDSISDKKLGIPLIESIDEYDKLNDYMRNRNIFLIIKLHPKADLSHLAISDKSNIKVISWKEQKKLQINN